jgi:flagellar motility protein MotE (MotC chaperone)
MPTPNHSQGRAAPSLSTFTLIGVLAVAQLFGRPAGAQDGRPLELQKPKANADRTTDIEVSRFCANVGPSVAEARIAWQTKRLAELDAQLKQRLADLEKAEASVQEWVAKRDAMLKAASDDLVAIYARMQPENAAIQLSAMDDQTAAAILGKLKPAAAGAILDEMEAERASKLASFLSGASAVGEKKS